MADEAFRTQVDELAAGLKSRAKVTAHLDAFLADNWDPTTDGPPDLGPMSMTQLAFLLLLDDSWEDFLEYLQAVHGPTPIGAIRELVPPDDGNEIWRLTILIGGRAVAHELAGWEVTATND